MAARKRSPAGASDKPRPQIIASPEVAARGPLDPSRPSRGATDPVWKPSWDRLGRYVAAMQAAQLSTDPDARAARELAAQLNRMADAFEAQDLENAAIAPEKRADDLSVYKDHRDLVKRLVRVLNRNDRDQWIAFARLVWQIETAAAVAMKPEEPRPGQLWAQYAERAVEGILADFKIAFPREAKRVTPAMLRAALDASHRPKKGAPKWPAFVPIAKALVGEDDADAIRKEVARLRDRQPL